MHTESNLMHTHLEIQFLQVETCWEENTDMKFHKWLQSGGLESYPDYAHAFLRLAAIAKSRNDIQLSIELVGEALRVKEKCPNALSMLGSLELKNDE
ncbi:hypothetical protein Dimus_001169 [Dionaea muscipula]